MPVPVLSWAMLPLTTMRSAPGAAAVGVNARAVSKNNVVQNLGPQPAADVDSLIIGVANRVGGDQSHRSYC